MKGIIYLKYFYRRYFNQTLSIYKLARPALVQFDNLLTILQSFSVKGNVKKFHKEFHIRLDLV